jgi:Domain of unknown function (DUF4111)
MSVPMHDLPATAAAASEELVEQLATIFGDDLVSAWLHGGTTFPDRPRRRGDLDMCAVIARASPGEREPNLWSNDPGARPSRALAAERAVAEAHHVAFDVTVLLVEEMTRGDPPSHAFNVARPVLSWPFFRAHWRAGRYVLFHGRAPEEMVRAPSRLELERALDRELEHLERHVYDGDAADPSEATYAVGNGCRILYTLETGSPVISKRSAGSWGLQHLAERWHPAIAAAGRAYDGEADASDHDLLAHAMAPFVEMVRTHLPLSQPRPPGPPRWSDDP